MTDKLPPHDIDLELAVLGAMLADENALKIGLDKLNPEHFYRDSHRIIFSALRDTGSADALAVAANIKSEGYSEPDKADLHACFDACISPKQIENHADLLLDLADRRAAIATMYRGIEAAHRGEDFSEELGAVYDRTQEKPPEMIDARALAALDLPPLRWSVPGILPQGFCIFAGLPKVGKSFLSLNIALAVAYGGNALGEDVSYAEALVLALEDGHRRLQARLKPMLNGTPAPDSLHFAVNWPRVDDGAIEHLENYLRVHPDTGLIVVDTLAKVRERPKRNGSIYLDDYAAVEPLKRLADDYQITLMAVHHLRKSESTRDPLDEVSGSTGLTGAADSILLLRKSRNRSDAELMVVGRDIEDNELALDFDGLTATWQVLGPAEEYRQSEERGAILEVLREAGGPLGPHAVAVALDANESTTKTLLKRMVEQGIVDRVGRGQYTLRPLAEVVPLEGDTV